MMDEKRRDIRNAVLCCLIFLACLLIAWPVAQMGFVDDWSYIKTAQVFASTGHFVYNGWPTAMLGWQIPWGALFIKVFGFSFMTVKLSTLPLALACLLLFYSILRRFEISPRNAVIGTLTLGLSPLFMPLAASFMTDVPGLFVILLCLYCCQRAVAAGSSRAAMAWLVAAAASNLVGGTARQVAWLGVLVMVPCTGWLLREQRKVLVTAIALWLTGIAGVLYCMHWFAQQPYVVLLNLYPDPKKISSLAVGIVYSMTVMNQLRAEFVCLLLVVGPVLIPWLGELRLGRKIDRYAALFCVGVLPLLAVKLMLGRFGELWPPHMLFKELSTRMDAAVLWHLDLKRSLIPFSGRLAISFVLIAAFCGCLVAVRARGMRAIYSSDAHKGREIFWLLVPYFVSYFVLLLPSAFEWVTFDRYALGLMPCAIAGFIWLYQRCVREDLPAASIVLLILFAAFSVAGTHDWFAWQRARLAAIHELREAGVPRDRIQGGFEYDGWTQIEKGGHINNRRVKVPKGAYHPVLQDEDVKPDCAYGFLVGVPKIHPEYSVAVGRRRCYLPSRYPAVHYTAWLPPFRRTIEVQRVRNKQ